MKAAICFSGHFRKFDKVKETIINNIIGPLKLLFEVDIFVATYDTIDVKQSDKPDLYFDHIFEILKPKRISVSSYKQHFDNFRLDNIWPKHNIDFSKKNSNDIVKDGIIPSFSQLFQIYCANQLKIETEKLGAFIYKLVIRCRPDFHYNTSILEFLSLKSKTVFVPNIWKSKDGHPYAVFDVFAFGESDVMDIYSSAFLNYRSLIESYDANKYPYEENECNCLQFSAERVLYRNLIENKVNILEDTEMNLAK